MTKSYQYIKGTMERSNSSPARREAGLGNLTHPNIPDISNMKNSAKNDNSDNSDKDKREGASNESGDFEGEEETGGLHEEQLSVEIIFDKNASNNNYKNAKTKTDCKLEAVEDVAYLHGVGMKDFDLLKVLGTGAYGKVFLVRKIRGPDRGQ